MYQLSANGQMDSKHTTIKHRQSFITYNIILESVRISSLKRTLIA